MSKTQSKKLYDSLGMLSVAMAMSHLKDNIPKIKTEIEKEYLEKKKELSKKEEEEQKEKNESFNSSKISSINSKKNFFSEKTKNSNSNKNSEECNKTFFPISDDDIEIIYAYDNSNLFQKKKMDFYEKCLHKKERIENKIEKKRKKIQNIENQQLTHKPNINLISQQIILSKYNNNYVPIFKRGIHLSNLKHTQYIINEQKKKLDASNLIKKKKMSEDKINSFIKNQFIWKEKIENKKLNLQMLKKIKSEDNLFNENKKKSNNISQFYLSEKTENLAKKKINDFCNKYNIKRKKIYERLYKEGITKEIEYEKLNEKYKNKFQPYVNKYKSNLKEGKQLKKNHSDINLMEKKMIDVNKNSKKLYLQSNSITKREILYNKNLIKINSLNNENDKKEEEESKLNYINFLLKNPQSTFKSLFKKNSLSKLNYDSNSTNLTNNNINIDSNSKRENSKIKDLSNLTINNIKKEKEEDNSQKNNNNKTLISFNYDFDENQKSFEESDKSNLFLKKKDFEEEPSWSKKLIEISNVKLNTNNDEKNKLYQINVGNSSSTKENKPFTIIGNNAIFNSFFAKK